MVSYSIRTARVLNLQIGTPDRSVQDSRPLQCLPDLTQCPKDWEKDGSILAHCMARILTFVLVLAGVLCVATESYTGSLHAFHKLGLRGTALMFHLRPMRG